MVNLLDFFDVDPYYEETYCEEHIMRRHHEEVVLIHIMRRQIVRRQIVRRPTVRRDKLTAASLLTPIKFWCYKHTRFGLVDG